MTGATNNMENSSEHPFLNPHSRSLTENLPCLAVKISSLFRCLALKHLEKFSLLKELESAAHDEEEGRVSSIPPTC